MVKLGRESMGTLLANIIVGLVVASTRDLCKHRYRLCICLGKN